MLVLEGIKQERTQKAGRKPKSKGLVCLCGTKTNNASLSKKTYESRRHEKRRISRSLNAKN